MRQAYRLYSGKRRRQNKSSQSIFSPHFCWFSLGLSYHFLFFVVVVISSWQWLRFPSEQKLFIRLQHFSLSFLQFLYKVGQQNNVDFIEHSYGGKRSFNRGHKLFFQYCGRVKKKKKMQLPEGQMLVVESIKRVRLQLLKCSSLSNRVPLFSFQILQLTRHTLIQNVKCLASVCSCRRCGQRAHPIFLQIL